MVHGHFYQPPRENPWTDEVAARAVGARRSTTGTRASTPSATAPTPSRASTIATGASRRSSTTTSASRSTSARRWRAGSSATIPRRRRPPARRPTPSSAGAWARRRHGPGVRAPDRAAVQRRAIGGRSCCGGWQDFRRRFGRAAEGLWLPETAADRRHAGGADRARASATRSWRPSRSRRCAPPAREEWTAGRPRHAWTPGAPTAGVHRDGSGRSICHRRSSTGRCRAAIAFGDATRDARPSWTRSQASRRPLAACAGTRLVLCASDGELYGHHKKFADLTLAFTHAASRRPRRGIEVTNLGAYLRAHPPTWEMQLAEGPGRRGDRLELRARRWGAGGATAAAPWARRHAGWNQKLARAAARGAGHGARRGGRAFTRTRPASCSAIPGRARDAYGEVVDASAGGARRAAGDLRRAGAGRRAARRRADGRACCWSCSGRRC